MKIAINKCFGGFDLSDYVFEKLVELGVPCYEDYDQVPKETKSLYVVKAKEDWAFGKYHSNARDYEQRTNPLLIKAIEEVGEEKSSGRFGEIRIIEIPDDVAWEIDEYDGVETVHEVHRSW